MFWGHLLTFWDKLTVDNLYIIQIDQICLKWKKYTNYLLTIRVLHKLFVSKWKMYKLFTYNSCVLQIVCLKMKKCTNCLLTIRVIWIVYCLSEDKKWKHNSIQKLRKKKKLSAPPLSPGMQEHVPEQRGKVRNTCIKNIQIAHCVIKLVGHIIVNP